MLLIKRSLCNIVCSSQSQFRSIGLDTCTMMFAQQPPLHHSASASCVTFYYSVIILQHNIIISIQHYIADEFLLR